MTKLYTFLIRNWIVNFFKQNSLQSSYMSLKEKLFVFDVVVDNSDIRTDIENVANLVSCQTYDRNVFVDSV